MVPKKDYFWWKSGTHIRKRHVEALLRVVTQRLRGGVKLLSRVGMPFGESLVIIRVTEVNHQLFLNTHTQGILTLVLTILGCQLDYIWN